MITVAIMAIEKTLVSAEIQAEEEITGVAARAVAETTGAVVPEIAGITGVAAIQAATIIVILKNVFKIAYQCIIPRQGLFQCRGFILIGIFNSPHPNKQQ